ncbi:hypothetical protein CMU78_05905 [Elizabethkingia anophelis]|uniref:hypothetical protein n=1 Tax=Elizabethkingia sp. M8 TaxID=2796140 RepID=UPI0019086983|nr:hypothetical protein [Elizabethkingia sp. M8]MDV3627808.1 hypothetical protein [Elizabethkingia anophelis]MDV3688106.1 hypothetical protein [Elizabethkingia anophelis]MDV3785209.1 hypothetical protein [Elizabethkingia anophelis]MDV3809415.1 hypothetical protein [Elizabethkingia anophelis]MDV3817281.1 hypothetical protein [Elizabethkingia anophelis]
MNPFEHLIEQSIKQQDLIRLAFGGNATILKLAEIQYNHRHNNKLLDIFDSQKRINLIINDSLSKTFQSESYKSIERALMPFKGIANITENLDKQLEIFNSSQILFKSSVELLTKSQNERLFKGFNPILPAISEITKSFLKDVEIIDDNEIDELEIINTVTGRINIVSENFIESGDNDITTYLSQVNASLLSLHQEIDNLKPKKREKWLNIIVNLMAFIGFIALFYNPLNEKNEKLILETNKKVNNIEEIVGQNANNILSTRNYKCLKLSDVFLKPDKNSKKIAQIKKGQKLKILEVRRKYCCIAILAENNHDAIVGYMLINNTNFND